MRGCRGLVQACSEEMQTLNQARFLLWPPENPVPSHSAVSLGGTEAQDKLEREKLWASGSGTRVVEEGLRSRDLAPPAWTSTPGPDSSRWVGPDLQGFHVSDPEDHIPIPPLIPSCSPLTPGGALARARPPGPHVGTTA